MYYIYERVIKAVTTVLFSPEEDISLADLRKHWDSLNKKEKAKLNQERLAHVCNGCIWARWVNEMTVSCPFPSCVKGKL